MLKGLKKKKIKTMNTKMATNSHLSTTESIKQKQKKLSKQQEEEQNHRYGDHLGVISREGEGGEGGEKYRY